MLKDLDLVGTVPIFDADLGGLADDSSPPDSPARYWLTTGRSLVMKASISLSHSEDSFCKIILIREKDCSLVFLLPNIVANSSDSLCMKVINSRVR